MRGAGNRALCASIVVLLLAGLGAASVLQLRSPEPTSADAPATEFSADRAWVHLEEIAKAPHPIGSPAHDLLARYLQGELEALDGTFEVQAAVVPELNGYEVHNLLIRFPGTDPTGTILFATHYDSVPSGPGVGDAGVSVAALVETARALTAGEPLRNDVIVMLTDGEEAGLFGGRAFVDQHPWAEDVDLVFNFEGRGVSGTPVIVEMEQPTVDLVSGILDAAPPLVTSPLGRRALPQDYRDRVSDFGEFRRLDIQGAHFAVVGESLYYHTPLDDLERSSRDTVQHLGETALGLARHFGGADLVSLRKGPDATWTVAMPGPGVVAPAWIAWPLLLAAVVLAALIDRRLPKVQRSKGEVVLGLSIPLLSMIGAAILGVVAVWFVAMTNGDIRRMLDDLPVGDHRGAGDLVNGHLLMWAIVALAAASVTAGLELARRRLGTPLLVGTGMRAWTIGLVGTTLIDPAVGAAFAGPFVAAQAATLLWVSRDPETELGIGVAGAVALLGAPVVMMGATMTWMGYLGVTLTGAGLLCAGPAVGLGQLLPQLDVVGRVHRWLPTALFAGVAIVLFAMAAFARQTDADLLHFVKTSSVWG